MRDLSTKYLGIRLDNPLVAASSGMTDTADKVERLAEAGIGAVVLKSLFEEQVRGQAAYVIGANEQKYYYAEAEEYIRDYSRGHDLADYLDLIAQSRKVVDIPVIASINCTSPSEWMAFAREIERAGAHALELNMFILPSDPNRTGAENEQAYLDILHGVKKEVGIPVSAKISHYFSGLASMVKSLAGTGVEGVVLFNRFFSPDIDIDKLEITSTNVLSSPGEISLPLRWVAMLSPLPGMDIAASTGIHDGEALVKQLLAGAQVGQIASVLYREGTDAVGRILRDLEAFMERHRLSSIDEFRGRMSLRHAHDPAPYERVQFMKYYGDMH
ncbi:dihydroorotate dehydrogenase-like protein [Prosthecochloris sp. CIB 2401]|uniref:dihydroorotate dehydrogenase-like protein n=1 Tax=Prosthecochloris sp. CIB 2401 TaxID=1868325 RepID=UPI00083A4618|nr:dihydroorotate dehydrogenase-like protein [Prosthecochloris sp. CIB 2401]